MGNIIGDWFAFRLRSKLRSSQLRARAKAGQVVFNSANKVKKSAAKRAARRGDSEGNSGADAPEDSSSTKGKKMGLFGKKRNKVNVGAAAARTCPAGHTLEPSWDQCPYCAQQQQSRAGGPPNADKTVAIRMTDIQEPLDVVGWVVALNGKHRGQDFRLHTGKNVVGTAADCDIVITDPYLSAHHATIRHNNTDGTFVIIDIDSTNGTFLNGKRISKDELIDNDTIRLGRTEFKFKALF